MNLSYPRLKELIVSLGSPDYRADQLLNWIYKKLASAFDEMSDLPLSLRQKLKSETVLFTFNPLEERVSADGKTFKLLFQLTDGRTIESTLMAYDHSLIPSSALPGKKSGGLQDAERQRSIRERRTVCVSTQVGCPVGCHFCATGQQGFERNLCAGEILEQVLYFARFVKKKEAHEEGGLSRRPITNVVFMGMGEPLANYENVWQSIVMLNSPQGLELGARQITVSTAGLVPQIRRLAGESLHVELAISLHAGNDGLRNRLMPINKRYPLSELIPACREYLERTGRRPTFEYALFQGVNDSPQNARELGLLLKGMNCSVNLIVGNPTSCQEYRSSSLQQANVFNTRLAALGIASTIRVSRGADIEAGCGQLRSRILGNSGEKPAKKAT